MLVVVVAGFEHETDLRVTPVGNDTVQKYILALDERLNP